MKGARFDFSPLFERPFSALAMDCVANYYFVCGVGLSMVWLGFAMVAGQIVLIGTIVGAALASLAFYVAAAAGKAALFGVLLSFIVVLEPILNHPNSSVMFVYIIVFLILEIVFHEIDALIGLGSEQGELVVRIISITRT